MNDLAVVDPAEQAIRQWHDMRATTKAAEEKCQRAVDEAHFLRGQMAVLQSQKERDAQELKELRGQVDEMKAHVTGAGSIILDLMEKLKAGPYRRSGSREIITKALADASPNEIEGLRAIEQTLDQSIAAIGAKHGADNPRTFAPSGAGD